MRELEALLERIRAGAYRGAELLGIKRDIEYRLLNGLGKRKAKIARQVWQLVRKF